MDHLFFVVGASKKIYKKALTHLTMNNYLGIKVNVVKLVKCGKNGKIYYNNYKFI
jgi:hypothetical protein